MNGSLTLYHDHATPRPAMTRASDDAKVVGMWLHGKAEGTRRMYLQRIREFAGHAGVGIRDARLEHVQDYADSIQDQARATRAGKLATIKSLLSFAHDIGYTPFNVGKALRLPKVPDQLAERILSETEVQRMIAMEPDVRNTIILKLAYYGGLRVSELSGLQWKHAAERDAGGQLTVHGKGEKTRHVLLSAPLWQELRMLRGDAGPEDPVFRSLKGGALSRAQLYRIVRDAAERAGLDKNVSPHWLRHAHASHALDRGAPVHLVKDTLGHASLATTSRYAHARPGDSSALYLAE